MQVKTGCGGWGYFNVPGDRLKAYSQAYHFVETNSTFYTWPREEDLWSWRRRVPEDFEFTVKANRILTHDEALRPTPKAVQAFDRCRSICRKLDARILVLQTPPNFDTPPQDVRDLFGSVDINGLTLVWEARGEKKAACHELACDLEMVPSVDISYEEPPENDLLYTRIFGPCEIRTADMPEELIERVSKKADASGAKKAYTTFHGSRMYSDAARFLVYHKN